MRYSLFAAVMLAFATNAQAQEVQYADLIIQKPDGEVKVTPDDSGIDHIDYEAPPVADKKAILSLSYENDIVAGNDYGYTNGVRAAWLSSEEVPEWFSDAAAKFPLFDEDGNQRLSFAFGQSMFTPEDITVRNPDPDDRPYAGFLYGSAGIISDTGDRLDNFNATIGIIGPASFAAQTQEFVHDLIDTRDPAGWSKQLKTELGVNLAYDRQWRNLYQLSDSGWGVDFTPSVGASLGNVYTYASLGGMLRFGQDLPRDYGPPRIRPSQPGSDFFVPVEDFGWYLFAGTEGRAIGRNIFLDGNTFRDSPSVDKRYFVADFIGGIAFTWNETRFAYTHVYRTEEYKTQAENAQFGAFNVSFRF
jgi:lipid A 3-O-deacylase